MAFEDFNISHKKLDHDSLRVDVGSKLKKIKCALSIVKYRDKDTRQIVLFLPSLEMTSYGATEEKAHEMMKFSLEEYFHFLCHLPAKKIETELSKFGWKHHALKNKQYSKVYVDITGQLKNFNAVADKVELLTIEA